MVASPAAAAKPVNTTFPLVLSLFATVICLGIPFGVPALWLAVKSREAQRAGSTDVARTRARFSIALSVLGVVFGALLEVFLYARRLGQTLQ